MCIYGEFSSGGMGINMVRVESKLLILKRIELEVLKNEVEDYFLLLVLVLWVKWVLYLLGEMVERKLYIEYIDLI